MRSEGIDSFCVILLYINRLKLQLDGLLQFGENAVKRPIYGAANNFSIRPFP